MQTTTQNLSSKKHLNVAPTSLNKTARKEPVKPTPLCTSKDNSLGRLLASCCDCV